MITLRFTIDNLPAVQQIYDTIELQRGPEYDGPFTTLTSGIDPYPISLVGVTSPFTIEDSYGTATDWYRSRYICVSACPDTSAVSGWSSPVIGEAGEICFDPTYPPEIAYGSADQLIIDRIRSLIGDPVGLKREYNECDNIHQDSYVYELEEKGWPSVVVIGDTTYTAISNPTVNGYRYLKFTEDITTVSGVSVTADVWYYTFRNSDREIMELYDTAFPPAPLTMDNATVEVYMLQTAIILLRQELWEDSVEDGAAIRDEGSSYNPEPGLRVRQALIDSLQKRLDDLVNSLQLRGITGVLLD